MKSIKINIKLWSLLAAFFMVFTFAACDDDDNGPGNFDTASLEQLIVEAETLMDVTEEGINAGDQKPGSKAELQSVIDWVRWKIENATDQADIADAAVKLQKYIDIYKDNVVATAMPWIQQENDTYIQISDNIKPVLDGASTIEIMCYIVDLNQKGYSNNLFSTEEMNPDSGFAVRYFGGGNAHVVVGNEGWTDTGDQIGAGTFKSGEWMHIALTNTGSHQILYVNGEVVAAQDAELLMTANAPFVIGNSPTWTDRVCNSVVKEFRVWNSVLDQSTIQANMSAEVEGTEAGLECYFPFGSDLGSEFNDVTGKYTATIKGKVDWVAEPPVIVLDKSKLQEAIQEITDFKATVVEGDQTGDYPIGTLAYIDEVIADANDALANEGRQAKLDEKADEVIAVIDTIKSMLVADATGINVKPEYDAFGFKITPNYTPDGDYTIEMDLKFETFSNGTGIFFHGYSYGIWATGYDELTEENVLNSGKLWNYTHTGEDGAPWWDGPKAEEGQTIKPGQWHHIALVHDHTARTTVLYVDGVEKGRSEDIGVPEKPSEDHFRLLGDNWGGKMDGSIKDFRMWEVVRAEGDLDADIDGTETGLKVYFPLDKVSGVKFNDVTGNYSGEMKGVQWNVEE